MSQENNQSSPTREDIDQLIEEILDYDEGEDCFLCQETLQSECLWDEVGGEILAKAELFWKQIKDSPTPTFALKQKQVRFSCYRHYIAYFSRWVPGMGRLRLPCCVERKIKEAYSGDGKFTGFKN